jgi:riboflavin kinase
MHDFKSDFYGHDMQAVVLGYIRPELDYTSKGSSFALLALNYVAYISSSRGSHRRYQHG